MSDLIVQASRPFAEALGLSKLPEYAPQILASTFFFGCIHLVFAPLFSKALVPETYARQASRRARNNWCNHIVSTIHLVIILPLAYRTLDSPFLGNDRAFGWDNQFGITTAFDCGYYFWDTLFELWNFSDLGFILHGFASFCICLFSFKPFLSYYGSRTMMWGISSVFLNNHWFLDKTGMTGSTLQLVNGILLLATFGLVRLVYGTYNAVQYFRTLYEVRNEVPLAIVLIYGLGGVTLVVLNFSWFRKIIAALQKRLGPEQAKLNEHAKEQ